MDRQELLDKIGISNEYLQRKIKFEAFNKDEWAIYKNHWIEIQMLLPKGRICPICGCIYKSCFSHHLNTHGISVEDWYCRFYGIEKGSQKCLYCNKPLEFDNNSYSYGTYCSHTCQLKYQIENKTFHFLSNNLRKIDGKSIIHYKSNQTRLAQGTHNLKYTGNKDHDKIVRDISIKSHKIQSHNNTYWSLSNHPELTIDQVRAHNDKVYKRFSRLGKVGGHRAFITMSSNKLKGWHSYPEELLGNILFLLNIHYIREYSVIDGKYRIDYYLPDYNVGLECDGLFKYDGDKIKQYWYDRKREIEINTGIIIKNIPSDKVFYYDKNKRDLLNLITKIEYPLLTILDN